MDIPFIEQQRRFRSSLMIALPWPVCLMRNYIPAFYRIVLIGVCIINNKKLIEMEQIVKGIIIKAANPFEKAPD